GGGGEPAPRAPHPPKHPRPPPPPRHSSQAAGVWHPSEGGHLSPRVADRGRPRPVGGEVGHHDERDTHYRRTRPLEGRERKWKVVAWAEAVEQDAHNSPYIPGTRGGRSPGAADAAGPSRGTVRRPFLNSSTSLNDHA